MKKIFVLIVILFSAVLFAQTPNWTGVKETNINVVSAGSTDIFTNRDGNHIIVQEGSSLKYYRMNINGYSDPSIFPITIESSAVISPSISGNSDYIFIVYGIGSQMRVRRSTNGGSSWSLWTSLSLTTTASWMESVVSNEKLHVTYLESGIVKYRYRNQDGTTWNGPYTVSEGETGTHPRITARYTGTNNDYVYFLWQKSGTHEFKHRKYEVTQNNWSSPLPGYTVSTQGLISSKPAGFRVTGSTLIVYYAYEAYLNNNYWYYFNWAWRNLSDNTLLGVGYPNLNQTQRVYSTTTFDNQSHTAFYYVQIAGEGQPDFTIRRSKQSSGYPDDVIYAYTNMPSYEPLHVNVSSAGNEVHAIWRDQFGNNNGSNLRYKYDDQKPIPPQNLTITSHNNHPKLVWQKNPEQDVDYYRIYKKKNTSNFVLHATVSASLPTEYVDNEETLLTGPPVANEVIAKYVVTARDLSSLESDYSNEVSARVPGDPPSKISYNNSPTEVYDYKLNQNYPNPFNPSTKISYSIKEDGFVSLKVYDILGVEITTLVNEPQSAGSYEAEFNAANLPSGMYIYKLQSGSFTDVKKMLLTK